jgi:Fe-S cluster assembly protein SufB
MSTTAKTLEALADREYKWGFVSDIEADALPPGLTEDVVRAISGKKNEPEFMLEWRLRAYRHWLKMGRSAGEPKWANVTYPPIDYQQIVYYSAPKRTSDRPASLDEVDPKLLETFEKLGIPLSERKRLAGVAVDAVFDSVSVATTFKEKLAELGVIFCSFSEAVQNHPELVQKYLGSVVPYTDNFYAALNSAVFSDGSFCYIPKGIRCPMELSTYFRINAASSGQFERTLIVAEEGSYVSYLEGCTAPMRESAPRRCSRAGGARQRPDQVLDGPELVRRRRRGPGRHLQLRHQARQVRGAAVEDFLDPGGDGLSHHLEVSERDPPGRRRRR